MDYRMVPVMGAAGELTGPVVPTLQYKSWPILGETIMAFELTDSQFTTLSAKFVSKKGNPGRVDGVPAWLVDNPNVLALEPAADGLSCKVSAVGPLGTAKVSMRADADLGDGVTDIIGVFDVDIIGGMATTVTLEPSPPEEQP